MDEVTITCLGDSASLKDLGLTLYRGDKVSVSTAQANRSLDLLNARTQGLVHLSTGRHMSVRTPSEIVGNARTVARAGTVPSLVNPTPEKQQVQDMSAVLEAVRELTFEVRALRAELNSRPTVIHNTQPTTPVVVQPRVHHQEPEAYIPSNLIDTSEGRVVVTQTKGDSGTIDDALAQLKAAKRK